MNGTYIAVGNNYRINVVGHHPYEKHGSYLDFYLEYKSAESNCWFPLYDNGWLIHFDNFWLDHPKVEKITHVATLTKEDPLLSSPKNP